MTSRQSLCVEAEALSFIYCGDHELVEIVDDNCVCVTLAHFESANLITTYKLTFVLRNEVTEVFFSCPSMSRSRCEAFQRRLQQRVEECSSQHETVIYETLSWCQERIGALLAQVSSNSSETAMYSEKEVRHLRLIELDHVRDKRVYMNALRDICRRTNVWGCVIFATYTPRVFIVLEGSWEDLKAYEKLHRTCNVDVDKQGRPCKERLMKVHCSLFIEKPIFDEAKKLQTKNVQSKNEMDNFLREVNIDGLLDPFLKS